MDIDNVKIGDIVEFPEVQLKVKAVSKMAFLGEYYDSKGGWNSGSMKTIWIPFSLTAVYKVSEKQNTTDPDCQKYFYYDCYELPHWFNIKNNLI